MSLKCKWPMFVSLFTCVIKTAMPFKKGMSHPYLRNNDVYLCFIIFCIYTVRYMEVNQNIPDSPNTGIFCKSVFCQSLNRYEHCTSHVNPCSVFIKVIHK